MLIRPDSIYFNYRRGQALPSPHRDPGWLNSPGEVSSPQGSFGAGEQPRHCSPFEPHGGDAQGYGRMLEAGGDIWGPRVDAQHHGGLLGPWQGEVLGVWVGS